MNKLKLNKLQIPDRNLDEYKPKPKQSTVEKIQPNRFFTPIPDNREQILESLKKQQEDLLRIRFNLP